MRHVKMENTAKTEIENSKSIKSDKSEIENQTFEINQIRHPKSIKSN